MAAKDTQAQVRLIQAQIEQARQAVAIAKKRLADCRVMAPISGQVERKFLNQGSYVDGGALLYRLVDNQRLELECYVSSAELGRLSPGQKVHFEVSAYPNQTFEARVSMISPAVQAMNRSVVVKAVVPNPGGKLRAGMFARGGIVTRVKQEAVVVPANAVWQRPNQPAFVFVVEQNHARKRIVKVGQEQPDSLEIVDGVRPGEVVVVEQYLELSEGSAISPLS
jgi:RND family efflux transporter MFP subunit